MASSDGAASTSGATTPADPLAALRQRLASFAPAPAARAAIRPTGVPALDALLPDGGVPVGRLTVVEAAPGAGGLTVLRAIALAQLAAGDPVLLLGAGMTPAPADWRDPETGAACWYVATDPAVLPQALDLVLRSALFPFILVESPAGIDRAALVRITRLAREAGAALVWLAPPAAAAGLQPSIRLNVTRPARPTLEIHLAKGGAPRSCTLACALPPTYRLRPDPALPDRRRQG